MFADPQSRRLAISAVGLVTALTLAGCSSPGEPMPTPSRSATPLPGAAPTDNGVDLDPGSPKCGGTDQFGVTPKKLPAHWPTDVPVIPGTCIASFEQADSTGGYALEVSVALSGTNVDFDNYAPWQVANKWLVDAGMETVFADTTAGGARESLYREGLVTSGGEEFYHYELRVSAEETPDGYVVIQYLLNLLNV